MAKVPWNKGLVIDQHLSCLKAMIVNELFEKQAYNRVALPEVSNADDECVAPLRQDKAIVSCTLGSVSEIRSFCSVPSFR